MSKGPPVAGIVTCLIFSAAIAAGGWLERVSSASAAELYATGTKVAGRITELTPTDRRNTYPRISYRFETVKDSHDANYRWVLSKDWATLKVGDAVEVWHRAGDITACVSGPERSWVEAGPSTSGCLFGASGLFAALAALLFLWKRRPRP